VNPRELSAELARLKQVAKSLMTAIEALQAKIDGPGATVPPPPRPTTRIRRLGPSTKTMPELPASKLSEPPPRSEPGSARGAYRYVPSPSKKR
jgi:hypothetical protein